MNLYEKIQAVSSEIRGLEKDMTVSTGASSYKAVSDKSVTLAINEAEKNHRIVSIPVKQELVKSESISSPPDKYGKVRVTFVDIVKMTLRIIDLDETASFIDVESFGRGVDASDKGFGKASTYARKYALLNAYKIATGVDPDETGDKIVEKEADIPPYRLEVENYMLKNDEYRENAFKHFNCASLDEFTEDQIKTLFDNLKKKGRL